MTGPYPRPSGEPDPDRAGQPASPGGYQPYGSEPQYEPPYQQPGHQQPVYQPVYQPPHQYGQPHQPPRYGRQYQPPSYDPPAQPYPSQVLPPQPGETPSGGHETAPTGPVAHRGGAKKLVGVLGVIVFAVVAVLAKTFVGGLLAGDSQTGPNHVQPSGITTTKAAPSAPFENTPASAYPQATAGITLPAAAAVSGFSKTQVDADLQKVRKALVAGRLDLRMLVSHDNSALLALLAPDAKTSITKDFTDKNFFVYATQIASGQTLTSDPIRAKGKVTFRAATHDDVRMLEVITNFVWVYPFSGELKEPGDHLVVVHDEVTWAFPVDADVTKTSRGMWIYQANGFASNMDCSLLDQSLLGLGKPTALGTGETQNEDAPFDPNGTLDIKDTC